jgi:hypothetical protein
MKIDLNDRKLRMTSIAGLMVYAAVVLKNGGEQMGKQNHFMSSVVGRVMFVGGWGLLAFSVVGKPSGSTKSVLAYGGALGVLMSVMLMKTLSGDIKKLFGLLFIASWIAFSVSVGMDRSKKAKMISMVALGCVISSMVFILPKQRELNVVDGPGMSLFAATFVLLAVANSL